MHSNTARLSTFVLGSAFTALVLATPSVLAYETEPTWVTNKYFSAEVNDGTGAYINGEWDKDRGDVPTLKTSSFAIDSTQSVFSVENLGLTTDYRRIIRVDCDINLSDFYYREDVTNDVVSAIGAIALVTNDVPNSASWMGVKEGNKWVALTGADPLLGDYIVRVELDYTDAAQPLVRYSVSTDGTKFTVLKDGSTEWIDMKADEDELGDVCFSGKAELTSIAAKLSTTAAAEWDETDYATVLNAMAAAKNSDKAIVLYKDFAVATKDLKSATYADGTYRFDKNDQTIKITETAWKVSDETGVTISAVGPDCYKVSPATPFAVRDGEGDDAAAYLSLDDAFDSTASGAKLTAMREFGDNAGMNGKSFTLDLAGYTITNKIQSIPAIRLGEGANLFIFGGSITGATTAASIEAVNGATIVIDNLVVTNTMKALSVLSGGQIVITNGVFAGSFLGEGDGSKIKILGGYILADSFASGKVEATGGKFSAASATALTTATGVATDYHLTALAVPETIGGVTIAQEVMKVVKDKSGNPVETTVWSVSDDTVGGVQIANKWVEDNVTGGTAEEKQANLQTYTSYKGGATMKKWEAYVLGMKASDTAGGPTVKGVQDNKPSKVGFSILTPESILAAESGCDVKFTVTEYTKPDFSEGAGTESAKVDYTQAAELDAPESGVRYYKLKMFITPKK